jgi:hypothetical protein
VAFSPVVALGLAGRRGVWYARSDPLAHWGGRLREPGSGVPDQGNPDRRFGGSEAQSSNPGHEAARSADLDPRNAVRSFHEFEAVRSTDLDLEADAGSTLGS